MKFVRMAAIPGLMVAWQVLIVEDEPPIRQMIAFNPTCAGVESGAAACTGRPISAGCFPTVRGVGFRLFTLW